MVAAKEVYQRVEEMSASGLDHWLRAIKSDFYCKLAFLSFKVSHCNMDSGRKSHKRLNSRNNQVGRVIIYHLFPDGHEFCPPLCPALSSSILLTAFSACEALLSSSLSATLCRRPRASCVSWLFVKDCGVAGAIETELCYDDCFCILLCAVAISAVHRCWHCSWTALPFYRPPDAFVASDGMHCSCVWVFHRPLAPCLACSAFW